jgi:hypothetical protein
MMIALSRSGLLADQSVDELLAADVHPFGGFIEQEQVCLLMEEAGEGQLLLVASAQFAGALGAVLLLDLQA